MSFSMKKVGTIARREYLTTVRRPAFVVTLLLTPAIFFLAGVVSTKSQIDDQLKRLSTSRVIGVVDSSGQYADATTTFEYQAPTAPDLDPTKAKKPKAAPPKVTFLFRKFESQAVALDSLEKGDVNQVIVVTKDFPESGRTRLYEHDTRVFTNSGDTRSLQIWLTRNLLKGQADSSRIENTVRMGRMMDLYTPTRDGSWAIKDDAKELAGFLLPFALAFLLAMAIITGGQYMLQGVSEEKESRILESLMCSVSPEELLGGKLFGLGSAGLTLVGVWLTAGIFSGASALAFANVTIPPSLIIIGFGYFLFGYLFYSAIMLGVGSMTSNLREATQISGYLTILVVCPFWVMVKFLNDPNSNIAVGMSLFPPTAATSMMLRMSAATVSGAVIPPWQIATSLTLLAASAVLMLLLSARLFRLGMLLYGKTPNLPEIMRIMRQK